MADRQRSRRINSYQEEQYKAAEYRRIAYYLAHYKNLICEMSQKSKITILDVGGGAGYFSKELLKKLPSTSEINIYVLDMNRYDTWNEEDGRIHFCEGDAAALDKLFKAKTFDYIFCNMLFHHLLGGVFGKCKSQGKKPAEYP